MSEGKDSLVSLNPAQQNPYTAKASDFPSSGGGNQAEGKNELCGQTENQRGPRHAQDGGEKTPSDWGKNDFSVSTNTEVRGSGVTNKDSVDLTTGKISVGGYGATRVSEVPDKLVKIPSR